MKKRDLKLVLIGDSGVGKSSFVSALINQIQNKASVLDKHPPINLPPDMLNHPECITTLIDTKCAPHQLPQEIQIADVILLMYAIDDDGSSERLKRFWLKELRDKEYKQPVIIVGNKLDLLGLEEDRDYHRIFKVIKQLVKDFNSVEMGIECSSIKQQGIYDVINCAQRSFLYPLAPIYSIADKALTEGFKKALTRIFRICDRDGDGVWSDTELEKFQKKVFKRQLDYSDIAGIKDMIEEELHDNSNKTVITLEGFIALQKRGIELMKIQICWTILRFFRYKDDLTLDENIFTNELIFDYDAGQTVELSEIALSKLKQIFEIRCNSRFQQGNTLTQQQFDDIFYPVMCKTNFPHLCQYYPQEQNVITLAQWLAMWNAFSFFNYKEAYKLLCYIGIEMKLSDTFKEQNRKDSWVSVQKNIDRKVFHIAIVTRKKGQFEQWFCNQPLIITSIQSKTYAISLYDELEAEQQIEKRQLSIIDFLLIEKNCHFQTAQLIPNLLYDDQQNFWTQIVKVTEILHKNPFGYSNSQMQQLKKQNSLSIVELASVITLLTFILTGGYFLGKKVLQKNK
ncbi:unnamed protein product (macronuclear) [Paramecium tetraurelia]|uniref:EF hand associated type-2 domain-containing protein n=1 Tax=Paramecium tetraurelia TaxID=5888 RepID=A0EAZ3_PARTE|nr:uncharacterized protein GSPATT00025194001 [Paramecium tetraurelia]CAK92460.1 unnamed protein product [Paramecium tetraurelia]|eukprot:XP_001459857.1 hypothetical protein (macronuclear) [Paramecium tetraurelia strain d4-2]